MCKLSSKLGYKKQKNMMREAAISSNERQYNIQKIRKMIKAKHCFLMKDKLYSAVAEKQC